MALNLASLRQASTSFNLLNTFQSTHSEPFSAVAELVDNAYDAKAKNCYVSYDAANGTIEILDDGIGMSRSEMIQVISFGHSEKTATSIGRYGLGLKTGAFHLGQEVMVLTKKDEVYTTMLLSTKFHKQNNITTEFMVPCPSFTSTYKPFARTAEGIQNHESQLNVIQEYGPLGRRTLQELFAKITGESGTLVIVGWIRKSAAMMNGNYIMDFQPNDFMIHDDTRPFHHQSLRAFFSMLYLKPYMTIYLQGTKVRPIKIIEPWMAKFKAEIPTTTFKDLFKKCQDDRERNLEILDMEKKIVESDLAYLRPEYLATPAGIGKKAQLDIRLKDANSKLDALKKENSDVEKLFKSDTIKVLCGVQTVHRADNGIHFFMNNRLIVWGHKSSPFFKNENSIGVCAIVNLNPAIFLPSASKQDFSGSLDFKVLIKKCNERLVEYFEYFSTYWIRAELGNLGADPVAGFWNKIGYADAYGVRCVVRRQLDDRMVALKKRECAPWYSCWRCGMWKRDSEGKIDGRDNNNIERFECKDVDRRGCDSENPKLTDDEGFRMNMEKWKKIQERMESAPRDDAPSSSNSGPRALRSSSGSTAPHRSSAVIVLSEEEDEVAPGAPISAPRPSEVVVGQRANEQAPRIFAIAKRSAAPRTSRDLAPAAPMPDFDPPNLAEPTTTPSSPPAIVDAPSSAPRDPRRTGPSAPSSSAPRTSANSGAPAANDPVDTSSEESSDEEEEEEEEEAGPSTAPAPVKRATIAVRGAVPQAKRTGGAPKKAVGKKKNKKSAPKQKKLDRVAFLEQQVNELLRACGKSPLPAGEFDLDLVALYRQMKEPHDNARAAIEEERRKMGEDIEQVLEFAVAQPNGRLNMPHIDDPMEKLDAVARQIRTIPQRGGQRGASSKRGQSSRK
ncbi:hypothetical protein CAEBREN_11490 [Caenorhabditis brenneri]|uniref:Morc S5 domain-containing protein n=1 Tax=Caenorhabditis brenneri TaxID=135651 RepID=G0P593_CAEBE|nr:hypothetical protein CAEBREN_11490 [Caenorhabditis brenneri]